MPPTVRQARCWTAWPPCLLPVGLLGGLGAGGLALQERRLVALQPHQFDRIVLRLGPHSRELLQRHDDAEDGRASLADPAEPQRQLAQATAWLERLLALRAINLHDSAPAGPPQLRVDFRRDGASVARLELFAPTPPPALATSSGQPQTLVLTPASATALLQGAAAVLREGLAP